MALTKKCGGVCTCLIILGCIFRKKCLQMHLLAPVNWASVSPVGLRQLLMRRVYLKRPPFDHTVVKVDFRNVFNSICRVLRAVKEYIPDLIPFAHLSYSSQFIFMWNDMQKYCQWKAFYNVTLCPMLFCLGIHNLISALSSAIQRCLL